jgi:hypothetical protein
VEFKIKGKVIASDSEAMTKEKSMTSNPPILPNEIGKEELFISNIEHYL